MPFAMLLGHGGADLVEASEGPSVELRHAALLGGQVLDEAESRWLSASPVAHFGAGMLATSGGSAALRAWAEAVAGEVDGLYIAVDHDVLDADEADWAVTMPEAGGSQRGPRRSSSRDPRCGDPGGRLRRDHDELPASAATRSGPSRSPRDWLWQRSADEPGEAQRQLGPVSSVGVFVSRVTPDPSAFIV